MLIRLIGSLTGPKAVNGYGFGNNERGLSMLVISAKGVVYDIPEKAIKKHALPRWIGKKAEIKKMFSSLSKVIKKSSARLKGDVEGQASGCCGFVDDHSDRYI